MFVFLVFMKNFEDLIGKTITNIWFKNGKDPVKICDEIHLVTEDGWLVRLYHKQDCCENVYLLETVGEIDNILHSPIIYVNEIINPPLDDVMKSFTNSDTSSTWTFYLIETKKGSVVLKWLGSSNGYYDESVQFEIFYQGVKKEDE